MRRSTAIHSDNLKNLDLGSGESERPGRVLLVSPRHVATFVYQDYQLLQSRFDAGLFQYEGMRSLSVLKKTIEQSRAVVIWFAGEHAAPAVWFARQAGVPVAIIIGGYDGTWIPEISYGVRPGSYNACRVRWILRESSCILAVSEDIKSGVQRIAGDVVSKTRVLHNAVDTDYFVPDEIISRAGVLSVGNIQATTIERKGWRLFFAAASAMPDVPFIAIGPVRDAAAERFVESAPPNLTWLGELRGAPLVQQFQKASVYVQASRHEGFGVAVAEAMACGCVPVVSRAGALPEVVGDEGISLPDFRPESAAQAVRDALSFSSERRRTIRKRVVDLFGVEQRGRKLCAAIESMVRDSSHKGMPGEEHG